MDDSNNQRRILGAKLRAARRRAGFTQFEAAQQLGVAQSYLSMIEQGKRRLSAENAEALVKLYGEENIILLSDGKSDTDDESCSVRAVRMLEEFARKSGSEGIARSTDNFICLCVYVMMRKLYLTNPHNTERIFSLEESDIVRIWELLADEPDKLARFAENAKDVKTSEIEPDEMQAIELLRFIGRCEREIIHAIDSEENRK